MDAIDYQAKKFLFNFWRKKELGRLTRNIEGLLGLVDENMKRLQKDWGRRKVREWAETQMDVVTEPSVSEEPDPQQLLGAMRKCLRIWKVW